MEKISLYICTFLSCLIIVNIIFNYMDAKYGRALKKGYIYFVAQLLMILVISIINLKGNAFANFVIWMTLIALYVNFLYFENNDKPLKRIIECEVLLFCSAICESLGVVLADYVLQLLNIDINQQIMLNCFEITFSKIVVIFMYYCVMTKLLKRKKVPTSKMEYVVNMIILIYTVINILVIAQNMNHRSGEYLLVVNLGCIMVANFYLLYFVRVMNEKNYLEYELRALEKQSQFQYEYYILQKQKYNTTLNILHDVNKHIRTIKQLYANGEIDCATNYTEQISYMLKPLLPMRYTGHPILDILFTDKVITMKEKSIELEHKIANVNLDFIEPIDVTTIFGNLLDNSIEACEELADNRKIVILINSYHNMISISIKNTYKQVKWKNGYLVSSKGENRGIGLNNVIRCIEKYDGDIEMREIDDMFEVEIFLNV
ncbi:MAG: GHKL domain-containing protein [Lachnospiraceae bacterium]|nr:GHKL domain-containing protein [Lachnospiraceae bacterium]